MKTLIIKDLALTEELDRSAMAAVHGGRLALPFLPFYSPRFDFSKVISADVAVSQGVVQDQQTSVMVGSNLGLAEKNVATAYVKPTQIGKNESFINIG